MKNLLRAILAMVLMVSLTACTGTTTTDDGNATTGTGGGTGTGSGTGSGTGTLPAGVTQSGTFTVTMDGTSKTLHSIKSSSNGQTVNTAFYVKSSVDDSLTLWSTSDEKYNDTTTASLQINFTFPDRNAVTTGTVRSNGYNMIKYSPEGSAAAHSYSNMNQGSFEPFDVVLTTAEFDGTTMHVVGTIDATLYDNTDGSTKTISIEFEITTDFDTTG